MGHSKEKGLFGRFLSCPGNDEASSCLLNHDSFGIMDCDEPSLEDNPIKCCLLVFSMLFDVGSIAKSFFYWVNMRSDPLLHGTNTFVTFIRSQLGYWGHLAWPEPRWPVIFVPLATAVYFIFRFSICGRKIDWTKDLPPLICVSLLTAPYGYIFDQSLLMITQITIIVLILETPISVMNRIEIIFCLSLLNIGVVLLSNIDGFNKLFLFLFPALLLLIWMRAVRLVKRSI